MRSGPFGCPEPTVRMPHSKFINHTLSKCTLELYSCLFSARKFPLNVHLRKAYNQYACQREPRAFSRSARSSHLFGFHITFYRLISLFIIRPNFINYLSLSYYTKIAREGSMVAMLEEPPSDFCQHAPYIRPPFILFTLIING